MTVDTTAPPTATTASPPPLSPDDFGDGTTTSANGAAAGAMSGGVDAGPASAMIVSGGDGVLSGSDRATLQQARQELTAARAALKSSDEATQNAGRQHVRRVGCYLLGFCDARGLIDPVPLRPGFTAFFGSSAVDSDDVVFDELDSALAQALGTTETRSLKAWVGAIGEGLMALGAGLMFAPEP